MKMEEIDEASTLLEVRQAYEMDAQRLWSLASDAFRRTGAMPTEMTLGELSVVREWVRRCLEAETDQVRYQGRLRQYELLTEILFQHVPPKA